MVYGREYNIYSSRFNSCLSDTCTSNINLIFCQNQTDPNSLFKEGKLDWTNLGNQGTNQNKVKVH